MKLLPKFKIGDVISNVLPKFKIGDVISNARKSGTYKVISIVQPHYIPWMILESIDTGFIDITEYDASDSSNFKKVDLGYTLFGSKENV